MNSTDNQQVSMEFPQQHENEHSAPPAVEAVEAPKKAPAKRKAKIAAVVVMEKTAEQIEAERIAAEEEQRRKDAEEEARMAAEYEAEQSRRRAEEEAAAKAKEEEAPKKKKAPSKPKVKKAIVECDDCHEDFTVEGGVKAVRCPDCETKRQNAQAAAGGGRPVAEARTLAKSKAALSDDRLALLLQTEAERDRRYAEENGEDADWKGDVHIALLELVEFRRVVEQTRLRRNELSKKSKAKAKNGGSGGSEGGDGGEGGGAPKESKAVRDAKLIAAMTADAVVKKMKGTEEEE